MRGQGRAVVIEDDVEVQNLLKAVLQQSGFDVCTSSTGREGVEAVRNNNPVLVTLDIGLPDFDGIEVLRRIRSFSDCHVVMVTGRTAETDILTALHLGADEYVTKPFRPRELRARIEAMMHRPRGGSLAAEISGSNPSAVVSEPFTFWYGGLVLGAKRRTIKLSGEGLILTRTEFDLFYELLRNPGTTRTRLNPAPIARRESYRDVADLHRKRGVPPHEPPAMLTARGTGDRCAPASSSNPLATGILPAL